MKQNISTSDMIIRVILAIVLLTLTGMHVITGFWGIVAWFFAAVFVFTAIAGTCPLYALFGISTCKKRQAHRTS